MGSNVRFCFALAAAVGLFAFAGESANAQLHGVSIAKGCVSPVCEGAETSCDLQLGYNDDFGDTIKILAAWDVQDFGGDDVRVPDTGDLPIVAVGGNTTCTVDGSLPCLIGPGGSTLEGLPGDPQPGFVRFRQDTYVVQPDDPDRLLDQAVVEWEDLCDAPGTMGCGAGIVNPAPAPASTVVTRCDDGNDCTTDTCTEGVCTFTPDCTDDADCDDGDACTTGVCTAEGCCEYTPITCDDGNDCTTDTCDPATGCVYTPDCTSDADCDDGDACTADVCTAEGCCENNPITCDDGNDCTTDTCDPATGCVYTPDCTSDADCDDGDACTMDMCTPEGCCEYTPITCDDGNDCTTDKCDPATGCVYTPDCTSDADCDDGDACTMGMCTPEGCCEYTPITCDDGNDCTTDTCDPATGCVYTPDCTNDADCDDGDACTTDMCTAEGCCEYSTITCDDLDPCTEDTCDPIEGCVYTLIDPPPPGCEVGGDGCTPGFWKQPHHLQYWMNYDPADMFEDVFGVEAMILDGKTLLEAAWTGGGGEAALGRHAVAALLNAASDEVGYAYTEAMVISTVQQAYVTGEFNTTKDMLAEENERGCTVTKWRDPTERGSKVRSRKGR